LSDLKEKEDVDTRAQFAGRAASGKRKRPMQDFIDVGAVLVVIGMIGSVVAGYLFNRENDQLVAHWPPVIAVASLGGFLILAGLIMVIGGYLGRVAASR
jgi:hypothetical protein